MTRLYQDLASWWPLLSAPEEYAEEAAVLRDLLREACRPEPRSLLELGSGGGNNASHLKAHYQLTLVDRAPGMLAVSRALNPECEHVEGDLRDVRLGKTFDAVLVHDAILYITNEADLRRAIETAYVHCRPGGAAVFAPDWVRETFAPTTDHGGRDGPGRGLRYLEWVRELSADGCTYIVDYAYLLYEEGAPVRVVHDQHLCGVFSREVWLRLLRAAGFDPRVVKDPWRADVFVAVRKGDH